MSAPPKLRERFAQLFPEEEIVELVPLQPDPGGTAGIAKAAGYGQPVRVVLVDRGGRRHDAVWRTASANELGHDRRADRAAEIVQAFDDYAVMPRHARAVDVGFIARDGQLISVRDGGEAYLVTEFARGSIYAEDLRRIAQRRVLDDLDLRKLDALVHYLAELHVPITGGEVAYRRAVRDLVGHGEGIFGVIDFYPDDVAGVDRSRLQAIEEQCVRWRHRLRGRHDRLTRTHGDFHPFNVVFNGVELTLLDASRGGCGDPADDVTAMAVNFLLFAVGREDAWKHALGPLWRRWWNGYLAARFDAELLGVAPPFFAWRTLVICNPRFYPDLGGPERDRLLGFAERILDDGYLDPARAEELFR